MILLQRNARIFPIIEDGNVCATGIACIVALVRYRAAKAWSCLDNVVHLCDFGIIDIVTPVSITRVI